MIVNGFKGLRGGIDIYRIMTVDSILLSLSYTYEDF